jgi:hypothetical protein
MIRPHTNHLLLLFKEYVVPQPQFPQQKSILKCVFWNQCL